MNRVRHLGLLGLAACALVMSGPSLAQRAANMSNRDIPEAEQARDTMNRYAVCLVDARRNSVKRALSVTDALERNAALRRIAADKCLASGSIAMPEPLFRGALYRALYLEEFGDNAPAEPIRAGQAPTDPLLAFGDCVVTLSPAAVRDFVVAKPVTSAENTALSSLSAALSDCVAPGDQVGFTRSSLQAILAEALYKRTAALTPTQTAGRN